MAKIQYFVRVDFGPLTDSPYLCTSGKELSENDKFFLSSVNPPIGFSDASDACIFANQLHEVFTEGSYPQLPPNLRSMVELYLQEKQKHGSVKFKFQVCVEMLQQVDISIWPDEDE